MRRMVFWFGIAALSFLIAGIATRREKPDLKLERQAEATGCNCQDCSDGGQYRIEFLTPCEKSDTSNRVVWCEDDKCGNTLWLRCNRDYHLYFNDKLIAKCCYYGGKCYGFYQLTSGDCRFRLVYFRTRDPSNSGEEDDDGDGKYDWQQWYYFPCEEPDFLCRECYEHPTNPLGEADSECDCEPESFGCE